MDRYFKTFMWFAPTCALITFAPHGAKAQGTGSWQFSLHAPQFLSTTSASGLGYALATNTPVGSVFGDGGTLVALAIADSTDNQNASASFSSTATNGTCGASYVDANGNLVRNPSTGFELVKTTTWVAVSSAFASFTNTGGTITPTGSANATAQYALIPGNAVQHLPVGSLQADSPTPDANGMAVEAPPEPTYPVTFNSPQTYGRQGQAKHERTEAFTMQNNRLVWGGNVDVSVGECVETYTWPSAMFVGANGGGALNGLDVFQGVSGTAQSSYISGADTTFIGNVSVAGTLIP